MTCEVLIVFLQTKLTFDSIFSFFLCLNSDVTQNIFPLANQILSFKICEQFCRVSANVPLCILYLKSTQKIVYRKLINIDSLMLQSLQETKNSSGMKVAPKRDKLHFSDL